jgi:hypothetical protein
VAEKCSWQGIKDVSGDTGTDKSTVVPGTRVLLRQPGIIGVRQHLAAHAAHGDVGTVVEPLVGRPGWTHVKFDNCPAIHRLADDEISLA